MDETSVIAGLLDALAVFVPVSCAGCGVDDRALCSSCRSQLARGALRSQNVSGVPVISALEYSGVVRNAILAFKENDRTDLAAALSPALLRAVQHCAVRHCAEQHCAEKGAGAPITLCAIPSSRQAWRRRGYLPVDRLLAAAALRAQPLLRLATATSQVQKGLSESSPNR